MGYANEEFERMLATILGGDYELKTEQASAILKILRDATEEQRSHLLTFTIKNFGLINGGEPMKDKRMDEERYEELVESLRSEVHRVFHAWVKKNPTEEELGKKLRQYLFDQFTNDEEQSVVLSLILNDRCVPYRRIPDELLDEGLTVGDIKEALDGAAALVRIKEDAVVIRNILYRRNLTPSMAMLIWSIMNRYQSEAERFVVFNQILANVEEEAKTDVFGGLGNLMEMIIGMIGGKR